MKDLLNELLEESKDLLKEPKWDLPKLSPCTHPRVTPKFDMEQARSMSAAEVQKSFPRFGGVCPDCGYSGVIYASFEHYIAGDW